MSVYAFVRNCVWMAQDVKDLLWPSQLVDALRERDYRLGAEHDAAEALAEAEEEIDAWEPEKVPLKRRLRGDVPAGVEPFPQRVPPAGNPSSSAAVVEAAPTPTAADSQLTPLECGQAAHYIRAYALEVLGVHERGEALRLAQRLTNTYEAARGIN